VHDTQPCRATPPVQQLHTPCLRSRSTGRYVAVHGPTMRMLCTLYTAHGMRAVRYSYRIPHLLYEGTSRTCRRMVRTDYTARRALYMLRATTACQYYILHPAEEYALCSRSMYHIPQAPVYMPAPSCAPQGPGRWCRAYSTSKDQHPTLHESIVRKQQDGCVLLLADSRKSTNTYSTMAHEDAYESIGRATAYYQHRMSTGS
jgi:hypothetical protein